MTTTEINEAIHAKLGFMPHGKWDFFDNPKGCHPGWIPNYCGHLDMMSNVEKLVLESSKPFSSNPNDHEPHRYFSNLIEVTMAKTRTETVVSSCGMHMETVVLCGIDDYLLLISATAMQRAEAFLKTFDLWK